MLVLTSYDAVYSNNDKDVIVSKHKESEQKTEKSIVAGEGLYVQCIGCHSPGYHRTGPKHCGIFGKVAGSDSDFTYTGAMKKSGITWNETTLNDFLLNPLKKIPGTSMGFSGISSENDRRLLIAFLKSLTPENKKCE